MSRFRLLLSTFPGLAKAKAPQSVAEYLESTGIKTLDQMDAFANKCFINKSVFRKIMRGETTEISDELLLQISFHADLDFNRLKNVHNLWRSYQQRKYR